MIDIPAPSLAGDMLGVINEREISIYLPPSYFTSDKRYPVVYFLPGYLCTAMGLTFPNDVDRLIEDGAIQEMIIVSASGKNELGGSFYVNSPVTGNWEDFIAQDVVGYVDANYRTVPEAGSRAISGFSMGGYGALNLAVKHPDLFSSVYAMSPVLSTPDGIVDGTFPDDETKMRYLERMDSLVGMHKQDAVEAIDAMFPADTALPLAYGAAFSPDPDGAPPYAYLPYVLMGGKPVKDEAAWQDWQKGAGGLAAQVEQYKDNWLKLEGIAVNYGTLDELKYIPPGSEYFAQQLQAAGIPVDLTSYVGSHEGDLRLRIRKGLLPYLSARLGE